MSLRKAVLYLIGAAFASASLFAQCPTPYPPNPVGPSELLHSAWPFDWVVLGLGGPTDLKVDGTAKINGFTAPSFLTGVGIAQKGNISVHGPSMIDAQVVINPSGKIDESGPSVIVPQPVIRQDLTAVVKDARLASDCAAQRTPTAAFAQNRSIILSSKNVVIAAPVNNSSENVLNLRDLVLQNSTLTLQAPPDQLFTTFLINITGHFVVSGNSKIVLVGGIQPLAGCNHPTSFDEVDVLYNVRGSGDPVIIADKSEISGVVLAPSRDIQIADSTVNGEVIGGGKQIHVTGGSQVVRHYEACQ